MWCSCCGSTRWAAVVAVLAVAACQNARPGEGPEPAPADSAGTDARPARSGNAVTADELRGVKVARAEELLAGRFAGVQVIRLPSGAISVRIRGGTSATGDSEPLYVIDGIPVQAGPGGALQGINPEDIARIEVLKDIGSTSFYGVRGANGVVLITTKR